jgi:hypothetical protein
MGEKAKDEDQSTSRVSSNVNDARGVQVMSVLLASGIAPLESKGSQAEGATGTSSKRREVGCCPDGSQERPDCRAKSKATP